MSVSARRFPRYTTFPADEADRLREPHEGPLHAPVPLTRLLKTHRCIVRYPDATEGTCTYERLGPAYHRFDFAYGDGVHLARQYWTRPLGNTPVEIEAQAEALVPAAFQEATLREQQGYFARAAEPSDGSRSQDRTRFQMSAARAKQLGGRYALCRPVGTHLVPVTATFATLKAAVEAWAGRTEAALVIAGCNRLDRRWELPRYNPCCALGHPRKEDRP